MSANAFVMSFMATPHNPPAHAAALQVYFGFGSILDVVATKLRPTFALRATLVMSQPFLLLFQHACYLEWMALAWLMRTGFACSDNTNDVPWQQHIQCFSLQKKACCCS